MNVLIFGLGLLGGGFSSATYFLDRGDQVRITDLRSEESLGGPLEILKQRGATAVCTEHRYSDVEWADLVIKNPAVSPDNPYLKVARKIETDISYLLSSSVAQKTKVIAITGTKGKTFTVATVTHILNSVGKEALQFGNMGISGFTILSELEKREQEGLPLPSYLVCELSSWQIRDLYHSNGKTIPPLSLVALTSLFPDHLNWYNDYQSYKEDKWLLFGSSYARIIMSEQHAAEFSQSLGKKPKGIKTVESFADASNQDPKNQVAFAICRSLGVGSRQIASALESFTGVPHRQEQVAIKDHIVFINDSAATIPESVSFSLLYCPWPFHLISGGTDKNLAAEGMLEALKRASSIHLLSGNFTDNKLIPLLKREKIPFHGPFNSMEAAFHSAVASARTSLSIHQTTAVILSPGATSYGLFLHEFDRGDQFRALVHAL